MTTPSEQVMIVLGEGIKISSSTGDIVLTIQGVLSFQCFI